MNHISTVKCSCTGAAGSAAAFQDKRYGTGRRLFTLNSKGEGKCTVCSATHRDIVRDIPKKKKGGGSGGGAKWMLVSPPEGGWQGGLPENNGYKKVGGK